MRVKIRSTKIEHFKNSVCKKGEDFVILRFRRKSSPIALKLSVLSARKRLYEGFKTEEEFLKWLKK